MRRRLPDAQDRDGPHHGSPAGAREPDLNARRWWWLLAASGAVVAARFLLRARVPDDYDSIGFVLAVDDFDLSRFQPHFPGYPVYVALARAAHVLVRDPLAACALVSALAEGAATWATYRLAGIAGVLLHGAAWLPWMLGGAARSDALAASLALIAFALVAPRADQPHTVAAGPLGKRSVALGALVAALMLGVRLSYWPLAASWLALVLWRGGRRDVARALAAGAAGLCVWLVPFLWIAGGAYRVAGLAHTHLAGHFGEFGGSIATDPNLARRTGALVRGLLYDGVAPHALALVALALVIGLAARRLRPSRNALKLAAIVALPYAAWVFFAQNVVAQPRHLLPLVLALVVAIGRILHSHPRLAVAAALLALSASAPLAWARAHQEPAAAQAARFVAAQHPSADVAVFGGRSIRFFRLFAPEVVVRERTWLSEVDVELERLNVLPPILYVSSEVEPDPARACRLGETFTFCRNARLDRQQPCLSLRRYGVPAGRR